MEEQTLDLKDYLDAFKRRRSTILSIASGIFSDWSTSCVAVATNLSFICDDSDQRAGHST